MIYLYTERCYWRRGSTRSAHGARQKPLPREGLGWGQICITASAVATTGRLIRWPSKVYTTRGAGRFSPITASAVTTAAGLARLPDIVYAQPSPTRVMLPASGLYSERARRATKTPPEGGVGERSDLYNGVSRSNDRRIYATAEPGMHDRGCYNIRTSYTLSRVL